MLIVLSPAKKLDFDRPPALREGTEPTFLDQAQLLTEDLRKLNAKQMARLMNISPRLAELNCERIAAWQPSVDLDAGRHSLFAFRGDVYVGLDADTLDGEDLQFAQRHVSILSGLYGLLRPLDVIRPYRLEMGSSFSTRRGAGVYTFWGERIAEEVGRRLAASGGPLVNLASREYFRAIEGKTLRARVVTPRFLDYRNGSYRTISFNAKRARGMMCGYAIRNRITEVEQLKRFDVGGWRYREDMSSGDDWVFARRQSQTA